MLSRGDYLEGVLLLVGLLGAALAAGVVLAQRTHRGAGPLAATVVAGVVASAVVVAAHQLPLMAGLLSRGAPVVVALALAAALIALVPHGRAPADPESPPSSRASWLVALAVAGLTTAGVLAFTIARSAELVTGEDALIYHLPQVARWMETGSLWQRDVFTPGVSGWSYPGTGNLLQLALVAPFRSTVFVGLMSLPFLALLGAATVGAAGVLGAPRAAAVLAAAAVVALPAVTAPALETAQVDAPMLAWFAAGGYLLLRHARGGTGADLGVGAIALGLALGTKWYGLAYVPLLVAIWGLARWRGGEPLKAVARDVAAVAGLVAGAGGVWLLRNWVEAGNPIHPSELQIAGLEIFGAPPDPVREAGGFAITHYATDADVWRDHLIPAFVRTLGLAAYALPLGALAALLLALRRPAARAIVATLVLAGLLALAYATLPFSAFGPEGRPILAFANTRYGVPALLVAVVAIAAVCGRQGRWRPLLEAALAIAALDGLRRGIEAGAAAWFAGVLAVAAAGAVAFALRRRALPGVPAAATIALLVAALVAGGEAWRMRLADRTYAELDPGVGVALRLLGERGRAGLAGPGRPDPFPVVLPLFGPRLEHEVEYVGRFVDDTLQRHRTRQAFLAALARGDYEVLWIGFGRRDAAQERRPPELDWARAAGWREVADSYQSVVLAPPR